MSLIFRICIRFIHIVTAMLSASFIIVQLCLGEDILEYDFHKEKHYRMLQNYSGLLMIFTGFILVVLMRKTLEAEHSGS